MSIKKFGIAAALTLCAVGAMASNFRVADQVYLPIAGYINNAGQPVFVSDVYLSNMSDDSVDVSIIFSSGATGTVQEFKNAIRLAPRERRELPNFVKNTLNLQSGIGQVIFNGCLASADCGPSTQNQSGYSPNFRNVSVESRIYSIPAGSTPGTGAATTGQLFSGIPWYNFASSLQTDNKLARVFITGLTQTGTNGQAGTYRSNIGLVNASQFSTTNIVVRLYKGSAPGAQVAEYALDLAPLGQAQVNFAQMFPGQSGSNFFVTVEQRNNRPTGDASAAGCVEGCPAFLAYASVLDNVSGDATTLESQYEIPLSEAALAAIYPAGSGKGAIRRVVTRR